MNKYFFLIVCFSLVTQLTYANEDKCSLIKNKYLQKYDIKKAPKQVSESLQNIFHVVFDNFENYKVSWLDFSTLPSETHDLTFCFNYSKSAIVGSGSRTGSVYFVKEKVVIFNPKSHFNKLGSGLNIIHEALGALGYPDEDYQITIALYSIIHESFFTKQSVEKIFLGLKKHLDLNERTFENHIYDIEAETGGVTGVGGGGDAELIPLKAFALNMAQVNKGFFPRLLDGISFEEYFTFLYNIKIEPIGEIIPDFKMEFKSTGIYIAKKSGDWLILIDKNHWNYLLKHSSIEQRSKYIFDICVAAATIMILKK